MPKPTIALLEEAKSSGGEDGHAILGLKLRDWFRNSESALTVPWEVLAAQFRSGDGEMGSGFDYVVSNKGVLAY
ncbi:hypothetical protein VNO78_01412 [Psophocarpus tetragonolobus]|uniref:Uncharacterized protein n=1 Tax=Psophocarpus tetragonolobus TaxID=3891 RepID=A0AAN9SYB5_PSOTE